MYNWLPEACAHLRADLVDIYWLLITPYFLISLVLGVYQLTEKPINPNDLLKRTVVSIILLLTFDLFMDWVSFFADGLAERINGIQSLVSVLGQLEKTYQESEVGWFDLKGSIIFVLNILSYLIAYVGVFVANALIYFVWCVLYVVSPLMILMYVSPSTSFVTGNLYKGVISVGTWKILYSILGIMLLKIASQPNVQPGAENFITTIVVNLCIGISILLVPFFSKSLISDGLVNAASGFAAVPAAAMLGAGKGLATKTFKGGLKTTGNLVKSGTSSIGKGFKNEIKSGFKGTRSFYKKSSKITKAGVKGARSTYQRARKFGEIEPPTLK